MFLLILCMIVFLSCGIIIVSKAFETKDKIMVIVGFSTIFIVILASLALLFMEGVISVA